MRRKYSSKEARTTRRKGKQRASVDAGEKARSAAKFKFLRLFEPVPEIEILRVVYLWRSAEIISRVGNRASCVRSCVPARSLRKKNATYSLSARVPKPVHDLCVASAISSVVHRRKGRAVHKESGRKSVDWSKRPFYHATRKFIGSVVIQHVFPRYDLDACYLVSFLASLLYVKTHGLKYSRDEAEDQVHRMVLFTIWGEWIRLKLPESFRFSELSQNWIRRFWRIVVRIRQVSSS